MDKSEKEYAFRLLIDAAMGISDAKIAIPALNNEDAEIAQKAIKALIARLDEV